MPPESDPVAETATARGSGPGAAGTAFHELVDELHRVAEKLERPESGLDEQTLLEGYRWAFSILAVGLDAHVWADPARPRFVDIVGPQRKWGGDNADAFYQYAPVDPRGIYRVRGRRGDAAYLSLTVYGGPDDGRYSDHIVGTLNDRQLTFGPEGTFELFLGPEPGDGAWIELTSRAVCAITRDYLVDPRRGRRAEWSIEALQAPPPSPRDGAELARRLTAARTWVREQAAMVPIPLGEPNTVDEPYPVPEHTVGWAAGDAAYAMGRYELADDQALVLTGRSPACAFWSLCLWNQLLHTYDYDAQRVTINGGQVRRSADGSWEIVVSATDPGHPNWVSTDGHPRGLLWFRWFLPDHTPGRPGAEVVPVDRVRWSG